MTLSSDVQRLIADRMARGGYGSPDEVVRAGLASLEQQELAADFAPGELEQLLEEGEISGPAIGADEFFSKLKATRDQQETTAG